MKSISSVKFRVRENIYLNIFRKIVLYLLLLIVMIIGGTFVLKIFDLLLSKSFENIWIAGFQVGFTAWLGWIASAYHNYIKNKKQK